MKKKNKTKQVIPPMCVHCRYIDIDKHDIRYSKCNANPEYDLISGAQRPKFCSVSRDYEVENLCGPQGRFFEEAMEATKKPEPIMVRQESPKEKMSKFQRIVNFLFGI